MTTYNKNTKVNKTDFKSYSIISLYVNSPQGEIPGPNILVPKSLCRWTYILLYTC